MNPEVDDVIAASDAWHEEMAALRPILLGCGLTEELKWAKPCYTHEGANVVIVQEMKDFLALMFFKGALLADPDAVLEDQGPNSRSARRMTFTSADDIARRSETVAAYVAEAIEVAAAGLEVGPPPELVPVEELRRCLDADPELRAAFDALTPGRRREYDLYIGGAKKAATRRARVEKCRPRILAGRGLRDR